MKRFKNIIAAVDLHYDGDAFSRDLPPSSREAVDRAIWLARLNSARLTFFYAFDFPSFQHRMTGEAVAEAELTDNATDVMRWLVNDAAAEGVAAEFDLQSGTTWLEIIRKVHRCKP